MDELDYLYTFLAVMVIVWVCVVMWFFRKSEDADDFNP